VVYEPERVQIATIPVYSSGEGFRVFPDHEYELEIGYDDTSDAPVDAMGDIDLYYHPSGDESITYPVPPPRGTPPPDEHAGHAGHHPS